MNDHPGIVNLFFLINTSSTPNLLASVRGPDPLWASHWISLSLSFLTGKKGGTHIYAQDSENKKYMYVKILC